MNTYIVDHNGSYRETSDDASLGTVHHYQKGKPVQLPEEAASALGNSAKQVSSNAQAEPAETATEEKDAKGILNRMVGNNQAKTK